jgi:lysozyme family protein
MDKKTEEAAKSVAQNTGLEVIGIGALTTGLAQLQMGEEMLVSGIALAAVGVAVLAIKYFKRA